MGNWLSSVFFNFDSFLFAVTGVSFDRRLYLRAYQLSYNRNYYDPSGLLTAAAQIAATERMSKRKPSASQPGTSGMSAYNDDTDMEAEMKSDVSDWDNDDFTTSSSDDDCPIMTKEQEEQMFERERQLAFRGRLTVGDPESFDQMKSDIESRCGGCRPSTSVALICLSREIGSRAGKLTTNKKQPLSSGAQVAVNNSFFPNSRKVVQKIQSKTFCCQYVKDGRELVVASQDEKIRFFKKDAPYEKRSNRYVLQKEFQVQACGWSILDVALDREGSSLIYGAWVDAVFYGRFTEPSAENPPGVTWHTMRIPDEYEHHMAVFSVKFSHAGDEVLCGASDHSLHVFDVQTKERVVNITNAHEDDVNSVCFGDESSHLVFSAGDDGLIKVWDRRALREGDHHPVGVFAGHRDGVTYIDPRGDNRYVISNCKDQTIKLWDLRRFSDKTGIDATKKCVQSQQWDYRWQPAPPGLCQPIHGDTSVLTLRGHSVLHTQVRAKFSPEHTGKRYIYTGCARGEVVVYDLLSGTVTNRLKGNVAVTRDVDWNPQENEIASCSWDGTTSVWQWDERKSHVTSPDSDNEDSCDEFYNDVVEVRKAPPKKKKKRASTSAITSTRRLRSAVANTFDDFDDDDFSD